MVFDCAANCSGQSCAPARLFLEHNLDLSYFAPLRSSLFFGKIFGTWFRINFGLSSAKICPGQVYYNT